MTSPIPEVASSILIVDECPVIRYGLKQMLAAHCNCASIGEASANDALKSLKQRRWGVVILGVSPPEGGLHLINLIQRSRGGPKIVFLSPLPEPQYASKAVQAGALGYLTKADSVPELVRGILSVLAGNPYVSSALKAAISRTNQDCLPHESLSRREFAVLLSLARGKRINEIAGDLQVNAKTVSTYRSRILTKMGMRSDADLVVYTLRHALRK